MPLISANVTVQSNLLGAGNARGRDPAKKSAMIGGAVAAAFGLGLLIFVWVVLARHFGCFCFGAAAKSGSSSQGYETPVAAVAAATTEYEEAKRRRYTNLAYNNNFYATDDEYIVGVSPEPPPVYSEANPVDPIYSDVCAPPVYDNIAPGPIGPPPATTAPVAFDNLAYNSTVFVRPSNADIANAKQGLKSTGLSLK